MIFCGVCHDPFQKYVEEDCTSGLLIEVFDDSNKVFVRSDCLLDLGMDFLVGSMVFVWDA